MLWFSLVMVSEVRKRNPIWWVVVSELGVIAVLIVRWFCCRLQLLDVANGLKPHSKHTKLMRYSVTAAKTCTRLKKSKHGLSDKMKWPCSLQTPHMVRLCSHAASKIVLLGALAMMSSPVHPVCERLLLPCIQPRLGPRPFHNICRILKCLRGALGHQQRTQHHVGAPVPCA